jgi:hypothetical protein
MRRDASGGDVTQGRTVEHLKSSLTCGATLTRRSLD